MLASGPGYRTTPISVRTQTDMLTPVTKFRAQSADIPFIEVTSMAHTEPPLEMSMTLFSVRIVAQWVAETRSAQADPK